MRKLWVLIPLLLVPVICGFIFLYQNAPRDWSLHWEQPRQAVAVASDNGSISAVTTQAGWDALWLDAGAHLVYGRFRSDGKRLAPDIHLRAGSPSDFTLGRSGSMDVAAWRFDTNTSTSLRTAIMLPGKAPRYGTILRSSGPLEHPQAFKLQGGVGIVFSWQKHEYDVYLTVIRNGGSVAPPVQLTHTHAYAFLPHAAQDSAGGIRLAYLDACCDGSGFNVMDARYTDSGRVLSPPAKLDQVLMGIVGQQATPNQWGIDVERDGRQVYVSWTGSEGVMSAVWSGARRAGPTVVDAPGVQPDSLAVSAVGQYRELVWKGTSDVGTNLQTASLLTNGQLGSEPDRVAFEGASDDVPTPIELHGRPGLVWEAASSEAGTTAIEASTYTPKKLDAPNPLDRLGLGLSNPFGTIMILVFGAIGLSVLMTMGNVIVVMVFIGLYLLFAFLTRGRFKWVGYTAVLTACIWWLLVTLGAPTPPIVALSRVTLDSAWVTFGGMVIFLLILTFTLLRRVEDLYRAIIMAFFAMYFISFLQALVIIQGQVAKI